MVGFLAESEALLKLRSLFDELVGLDERFTSPEGGLWNSIDIGVFWSFRGFKDLLLCHPDPLFSQAVPLMVLESPAYP